MREAGFLENVGFSSLYQPGTIMRIRGADESGIDPEIFYWGDECFPGREPRETRYLVPETVNRASASFTLGTDGIQNFMPTLLIDDAVVSEVSLRVENCRLRSFAEADLAGNLSSPCVESLKRALLNGKEIEWFAVITKSIVADSLTMEIKWRSGSGAKFRMAAKNRAKAALAKTVGHSASKSRSAKAMAASVKMVAENKECTIFSGRGELVIGYHLQYLKPEYDRLNRRDPGP